MSLLHEEILRGRLARDEGLVGPRSGCLPLGRRGLAPVDAELQGVQLDQGGEASVGSLVELHSSQLLQKRVELRRLRGVSRVHRGGEITESLVDAVARSLLGSWADTLPNRDQLSTGRAHPVQVLHAVHLRDRSVQLFPLEPLRVVQELSEHGQHVEVVWVYDFAGKDGGGAFVVLAGGPKVLARQHDVVPDVQLGDGLGGKPAGDVLPLDIGRDVGVPADVGFEGQDMVARVLGIRLQELNLVGHLVALIEGCLEQSVCVEPIDWGREC